jgi:hypothetical protein
MIPQRVLKILETVVGDTPQLPPTIIFNEGWMLRLILDSLNGIGELNHPLAFAQNATWFSEALLPTAFRPRTQADKLSESFTHADGAIGHIEVARSGNAYVHLSKGAKQFIITEAKMFSALSSGVKNAPTFNQAARNVACIAEVLHREKRSPDEFESIGFYVLAPREAIDAGVFEPVMSRDHIAKTVAERVRAYGGALDNWLESAFAPLLERIDVKCFPWEDLVSLIESAGQANAPELRPFYENCLKYNRPREKS